MKLTARTSSILGAFALFACAKAERPSAPSLEHAPTARPEPSAVSSAEATAAPTAAASAAAQPGLAPTPSLAEEKPKSALDRDKAEPALATVPEAEKALAEAQKELDTVLGPAVKGGAGGASPLSAGDTRCPNACKAMESLRHAADAICRLTSPTDQRCSHAKDVVKTGEKRVSVCGCGS